MYRSPRLMWPALLAVALLSASCPGKDDDSGEETDTGEDTDTGGADSDTDTEHPQ